MKPGIPNPQPSLSILTAVLNRKLELERMVRSVLDQTFTDFEVVIVDNGSSDGSLEYSLSLAHKDRRFRVFQEPRRGLAFARNATMRHARGRWSVLLDSDNYFVGPGTLQSIFEILKRNPQAKGLFTASVPAGRVPADDGSPTQERWVSLGGFLRLPKQERPPVVESEWYRAHPYPELPECRTECPAYVWYSLAATGLVLVSTLPTQVYSTDSTDRICSGFTPRHSFDMARCYDIVLRAHGDAIRNASAKAYAVHLQKKWIHYKLAAPRPSGMRLRILDRLAVAVLPPRGALAYFAGLYSEFGDSRA
jgi:glycosyltransferase involved in cell wall biosynthesis